MTGASFRSRSNDLELVEGTKKGPEGSTAETRGRALVCGQELVCLLNWQYFSDDLATMFRLLSNRIFVLKIIYVTALINP